MNMYKVKEILHSGTKGEKYTPRTDGRYPLRISRLCDVYVKAGLPMKIEWITDENGNDYKGYSIWTSTVGRCENDGKTLTVHTLNSIYVFEHINDHDI